SCSVHLTSSVVGTTVVNASTTNLVVGGVSLFRITDGIGANSGTASKSWLDIAVDKTATPLSMTAPGGTFTFNVTVTNPSPVSLTLISLVDNIYGDLDGKGTCAAGPTGPVIAANGGTYTCSFPGTFMGAAADSETDIVKAT